MKIKRNKRLLFIGCCVLLIVALLSGTAISLEAVTITGTVKDGYLLTDNDQVYYIGEGSEGNEVAQLEGKKVSVTGTIKEEDGTKIITVTSYDIIEE